MNSHSCLGGIKKEIPSHTEKPLLQFYTYRDASVSQKGVYSKCLNIAFGKERTARNNMTSQAAENGQDCETFIHTLYFQACPRESALYLLVCRRRSTLTAKWEHLIQSIEYNTDTGTSSPELVSFLSTWDTFFSSQSHLGRGSLNGENACIWLAYREVCGNIFLINHWWGRAQDAVGSATPGQVMLGCVQEQAGQVMRSKLGPSALQRLCFRSCLQFLSEFLFWLASTTMDRDVEVWVRQTLSFSSCLS